MVKAVYPGSFDPVTNGHMDIIKRAARIVDELIIVVSVNSAKNPMFSMDERLQMIGEVTKEIPNVRVMSFEGLTVECARRLGATVIIRGLRAVTDFENEMQLAQTNHYIDSGIDTMFLATGLEYSFLSSTIVKELAYYGSDISRLVPGKVEKMVNDKIKNISSQK
ncbi:MAG: pantetheine-phosphate adenylyltransferase [Lachnospiraceae bacterium]|nr:pantetheine-phosphate adenylyltransferase [Lachnospiraceae bacterium]